MRESYDFDIYPPDIQPELISDDGEAPSMPTSPPDVRRVCIKIVRLPQSQLWFNRTITHPFHYRISVRLHFRARRVHSCPTHGFTGPYRLRTRFQEYRCFHLQSRKTSLMSTTGQRDISPRLKCTYALPTSNFNTARWQHRFHNQSCKPCTINQGWKRYVECAWSFSVIREGWMLAYVFKNGLKSL